MTFFIAIFFEFIILGNVFTKDLSPKPEVRGAILPLHLKLTQATAPIYERTGRTLSECRRLGVGCQYSIRVLNNRLGSPLVSASRSRKILLKRNCICDLCKWFEAIFSAHEAGSHAVRQFGAQ